ncbi:MAG: hypothetical protein GEV06_24135 [Luteitalea sp.]|nr:hypothetical protein [Luteitalea sp.]
MSLVSQAPPFDRNRAHALRPNFLGRIRRGEEPHIFQLATLSVLTGTALEEWLTLFGYDPATVPRWQIALHGARTVAISSRANPCDLQRFSHGLRRVPVPPRALPTEEIVGALPTLEMPRSPDDTHLYLKLGRDDRLLPSRFAAGSYVSVDTNRGLTPDADPEQIYAVEHLYGLSVCRLARVDSDQIRLLGEIAMPFPSLFVLGTEAGVLGSVDAELQPFDQRMDMSSREPPRLLARPRQRLVSVLSTELALHHYVAAARERAGLSLREAAGLAAEMAAVCGPAYAMARSTFERYETIDTVPHHLAKLFTLASVYALDVWHYLALAGMVIPLGTRMFDDLELSEQPVRAMSGTRPDKALLQMLRAALGKPALTIDDLYTFGRCDNSAHPLIEGGTILVLDRRRQHLELPRERSSRHQEAPLLLMQASNRGYHAGYATIRGRQLTLEPPPLAAGPVHHMDVDEASVVGRVVAVLRIGSEVADLRTDAHGRRRYETPVVIGEMSSR